MIVREIETPYEWMRLGADGIIRVVTKPGIHMDLEASKAGVRTAFALAEQHRVPLLVDGRVGRGISRESRVYFTSDAMAEFISAVALLVSSPVDLVLGRVMLTLSAKGPVTIRLFGDEAAALHWLQQFVTWRPSAGTAGAVGDAGR